MAITIETKTNEIISISEYIEWVHDNVDINDQDSIVESAPKLLALSNNRELMTEILHSPLKGNLSRGIQDLNGYTDSTFILGYAPNLTFYVRANVWFKPKPQAGTLDWESELYSYYIAHDHNFNFLTVGHHGKGYRTEIYECNPNRIVGYIGEHVDLQFLEDTRLDKDKVLFFRKSQDVHIQYPTEDLSISVNLMIVDGQMPLRPQYLFDLKKKKITQRAEGYATRRQNVILMAQETGDENTFDLLNDLSMSHPCAITRLQAFKSLIHMRPDLQDEILGRAVVDNSKLVKYEIDRILNGDLSLLTST